MRRWLARMSGMRVRNTPGAPLLFRPRLRYALRAGPACPRGPRDKLPRDSEVLSLSLSLSPHQLQTRTRSTTLGESNAPAGTRRHHANLQVDGERGTMGPLLVPLFAFQAPWIISYLAAVLSIISTSLVLFSEPYESRTSLDSFSGKRGKNAFQCNSYYSHYAIIINASMWNKLIIFRKIWNR